ncbi:hypothetical protein BC941DRAFT_200424 [Chlamydoabsidia padenii]|nr:hypothetical protein BC941DRAFT_200424 [Chlamydoabsidia padenii]
MQQGNSTHINNKKTEEVGPISFDETWKAVGSLSRRGSLAPTLNGNTSNKHSPAASPTPNSSIIPARRSSLDPIQWGYFGGFQWETTGLFNNETRKSSFSHPTAVTMDGPTLHQRPSYDNILSVPMLPGVSMEPIYRQQRSLSFSVGQDPTFFGHNDNVSNDLEPYGYKNSLAIMEEEEHEDMIQDMINQESNSARWRARSQSSGAVFGLMAISQQNNLLSRRRGSEQHDDLTLQQRRSSRFFGGMDGSTHLPVAGALSDQSTCASMTMMNQKQLDGMQRRSSLSHGREYIFPDQR